MPVELKSLRVLPDKEWTSQGIRKKPDGCKNCLYQNDGKGFCPDEVPPNPLIGILMDAPSRDDIVDQRPMVGKAGKYWEYHFIKKLGFKREDVAIFNVLRCSSSKGKYPQGPLRIRAEKMCRQYDGKQGKNGAMVPGGLLAFDPNLFIITFHPDNVLLTPPLHRLVLKDMEKAFDFALKYGKRPLVLMGKESMELVCPWARNGGMKTWRSHWYEGSLPFKYADLNKKEEKSFFSAKSLWKR